MKKKNSNMRGHISYNLRKSVDMVLDLSVVIYNIKNLLDIHTSSRSRIKCIFTILSLFYGLANDMNVGGSDRGVSMALI